jgi:hypothetical protein
MGKDKPFRRLSDAGEDVGRREMKKGKGVVEVVVVSAMVGLGGGPGTCTGSEGMSFGDALAVVDSSAGGKTVAGMGSCGDSICSSNFSVRICLSIFGGVAVVVAFSSSGAA